ncbi:hypothetical protein KQS06HV_100034 [Klebsiella quasipneumoniae subsp. similipneumoniae]|nr:hypothetical protein KQS06HV_100034 [Klebsiella quasipneumoniae subsp. similipneumoniae]
MTCNILLVNPSRFWAVLIPVFDGLRSLQVPIRQPEVSGFINISISTEMTDSPSDLFFHHS